MNTTNKNLAHQLLFEHARDEDGEIVECFPCSDIQQTEDYAWGEMTSFDVCDKNGETKRRIRISVKTA